MKFKSIRMKNFMRYKGDVTIEFSTDPEKNVTIILGDNSFGKTTIAQAFRWGLYGEVATTNYSHKKDVILLNNEVIASMSMDSKRSVEVEICVQTEKQEYQFRRTQYFSRKSSNPAILSIKPLTATSSLSMYIKYNDGTTSGWVSDQTGNGKEFPKGCVSDAISNMFPQKLSSYFFFDGERWNSDAESHGKDELKKSINAILGLNSLRRMMEHLKDGVPGNRTTVERTLNASIQGSSTQSDVLNGQINDLENQITVIDNNLDKKTEEKDVLNDNIEKYTSILADGRKAEEDQRELRKLETEIRMHTEYRNDSYSDLVKLVSSIDKRMAASLLPAIERELSSVDLEGKDIPGVTADTIDYLIKNGLCLCGEALNEGDSHYSALLRLREEVYPNKIGGPAKVYKGTLSEWQFQYENLIDELNRKAEKYEIEQNAVEDAERKKTALEERVDRKQNMAAVRAKLEEEKKRMNELVQAISNLTNKKEELKKNIKSLREQLELIEAQNKANKPIYKAISLNSIIYSEAKKRLEKFEKPTVTELSAMIARNFQKMFGSQDKYAKLDDDYQVKLYYRSLGGKNDHPEENLATGERIALNFAYIVSILEMAKIRRELDNFEDAVSSLPLVLDAPFSNLSGDNTGTVAASLPQFAEQVIIFMLDKDLEASGLLNYTDRQHRYRVSRNVEDNNSTIILNDDYLGGEI